MDLATAGPRSPELPPSLAARLPVDLPEKQPSSPRAFGWTSTSTKPLAYQQMFVSRDEPRSTGTGRFLSVDPNIDIERAMYRPQAWNRYAYVENDPLGKVDPDGRDTWDVINGAANAFGSDLLLGAGRVDGNTDFRSGQQLGDLGALAVNGVELVTGGGGEVGGLVLDATGVGAIVGVPAQVVSTGVIVHGVASGTVALAHLSESVGSPATGPYKRPSGATTPEQRAAQQGKPCAVCGADDGGKRVAGHKEALVEEHYRTGTVDKAKMRDVNSVRPECPTCSAREGGRMSRFSKYMKELLGF